MDSRLRGNDGNNAFDVIPAQAGIHTAGPNTNACGRRRGHSTRRRNRVRFMRLRRALVRKPMDSRLRGNDGRGASGRRRADYHSRLCGNDLGAATTTMLMASFPRRRRVLIGFRHPPTAQPRTRPSPAPPAVIAAQAGIHQRSPPTHGAAPDTPIAGTPLPSFPRRRESIGFRHPPIAQLRTRHPPAPPPFPAPRRSWRPCRPGVPAVPAPPLSLIPAKPVPAVAGSGNPRGPRRQGQFHIIG